MFYDQLKKLCNEKGLKITPLVKNLGMSTGNLKRWQEGISPTKETLLKFSEYFNVTTDYLLGLTDDPAPHDINKTNNDSSITNKEEAFIVDLKKMIGREPTEEDLKRLLDMAKLLFEVKE